MGAGYGTKNFAGSRANIPEGNVNLDSRNVFELSNELWINGILRYSTLTNNFADSAKNSASNPLQLLANKNSGQTTRTRFAKTYLYSCQIWNGYDANDERILVRDYWPCKRVTADGAVTYGLYDFALQKFVAASAGSFEGGDPDKKFVIKYSRKLGKYVRTEVVKGIAIFIY